MNKRGNQGFTLIELLIIIGIIGFLAAAILVAVDPVKRVQDARNAKRWSEVNAMLNAILTKQVDDRQLYDGAQGALEADIIPSDTDAQVIVRVAPPAAACAAAGTKPLCPAATTAGLIFSNVGVDCVAQLAGAAVAKENIAPEYIAEVPLDPTSTTPVTGPAIGDNNTGYYIQVTTKNRIEIGSCYPDPDSTASIKVKR